MLQQAVVGELAKADLKPVGIDPNVVLRDAKVGAAAKVKVLSPLNTCLTMLTA